MGKGRRGGGGGGEICQSNYPCQMFSFLFFTKHSVSSTYNY